MPRLRSAVTGVVVSMTDHVAGHLGSEWEPDPAAAAPPEPVTPLDGLDADAAGRHRKGGS